MLLVAALAVRVSTESVPSVRVARLLAARMPIRGPRPKLAWPREGESAVEVAGVGRLGVHGSDKPVPIASVAKVMTAYLTLREFPLQPGSEGFELTVTKAEVREEHARVALEESVVPVAAGERLSERQALQALLLPSANNVAAMLARHDAGSEAAFIARMNATASNIGMTGTRYTDPSGFLETTVSTPTGLLELAAVAMREPGFAALVNEREARLPVAGRVVNYNGLLGSEGYVGIKTGSDEAAGGCLLFAKRATVAGHHFTILGVVLGQHDGLLVPAALASAQRLGNSAAAALREGTVLPAGARVLVAHGVEGQRASIVTKHPLDEIGWGGLRVPVTVSLVDPRDSKLAAGTSIATVSVDGASTASSRAVAARSLGQPSLGWRLRHAL
ncbi:MAG: D-alanyl-D-alanine carboxypeptidase family protein [Solirubrobacteraceae bacterium]